MADYTDPAAVTPETAPAAAPVTDTLTPAAGPDQSEIETYFKERVEKAKRARKVLLPEWKRNVDGRMGKPLCTNVEGILVEGDRRTEINPDWSLTKTKTANLYSQVPAVQVTHEQEQYKAAIPPFAKALNYELGEKRANVGVPMEEVLNDVVNASGVGAIYVGYAARFEKVQVPSQDLSAYTPEEQQQMLATGQVTLVDAQREADTKFYTTRISPSDLLWPSEFTGSNFDDAAWIGRSGRMSWAEAKTEFKLTDEQKESVVGADQLTNQDDLRTETSREGLIEFKAVRFDEVFYWRYRMDPECSSFREIWRLVQVDGLDKPAIHEPWKGQQRDPQTGKYIGACKFPIRVLTLTYISDNSVPPSDSSAGRAQVNDMRLSRSQMFKNRERSIPIRWYDVNRIDPTIQDSLMRGTWQAMIPTNGDGSRSIGEIARASYPSEDLAFDRQVKTDLMETWQIGPNQLGTTQTGEKTKAEVVTTQANFATRIGQERARVATFFLSIAEVLSGLMVLYSDFPVLSDQERQQMQQAWDSKHILHDLVLKIRPDSAIMIDSNARIERLIGFLNMTAKSGVVNILPVVTEIAELSGLDPAQVIKQPNPPAPNEPAISYRFGGKEDLMSPVVMAILMKSGQAPSPDELKAAVTLLKAAQEPDQLMATPSQAPPGAPQGPGGGPAPTIPPTPEPPKDYSLPDRVAKRSRDIAGG